jgi:hypothetical protein
MLRIASTCAHPASLSLQWLPCPPAWPRVNRPHVKDLSPLPPFPLCGPCGRGGVPRTHVDPPPLTLAPSPPPTHSTCS